MYLIRSDCFWFLCYYLAYDLPPVFSQSEYKWIIQHESLPAPIATLDVSSDMDFSLAVLDSTFLPLSGLSGQGLVLHEFVLQATRQFVVNMNRIKFPITGYIRATDARTQCVTPGAAKSGPCVVDTPFSLSVTTFKPSCPKNIVRFTSASSTVISWKLPRLFIQDGDEVPLSSSHVSGGEFALGSTTVSYTTALAKDPSQSSETVVKCNFQVCWIHHLFLPANKSPPFRLILH